MRGAIPPLPKYVFMARCLVKHRDNFIFTFTISSPKHVENTFMQLCISLIILAVVKGLFSVRWEHSSTSLRSCSNSWLTQRQVLYCKWIQLLSREKCGSKSSYCSKCLQSSLCVMLQKLSSRTKSASDWTCTSVCCSYRWWRHEHILIEWIPEVTEKHRFKFSNLIPVSNNHNRTKGEFDQQHSSTEFSELRNLIAVSATHPESYQKDNVNDCTSDRSRFGYLEQKFTSWVCRGLLSTCSKV